MRIPRLLVYNDSAARQPGLQTYLLGLLAHLTVIDIIKAFQIKEPLPVHEPARTLERHKVINKLIALIVGPVSSFEIFPPDILIVAFQVVFFPSIRIQGISSRHNRPVGLAIGYQFSVKAFIKEAMGVTLHQILSSGEVGGFVYCRTHSERLCVMNQYKIGSVWNRVIRPIAIEDNYHLYFAFGVIEQAVNGLGKIRLIPCRNYY